MHSVAVTGALVVAAVNLGCGLFGGVRWWQAAPDRRFWPALRGAQALAVAYAVLCGVLALAGLHVDGNLFWLYALMPVAVSFVAEQLRAVSADTVLSARDLDDAAAVGQLPEDEQRAIVRAILNREMGVMAASAVVVAFLALRAAGTV